MKTQPLANALPPWLVECAEVPGVVVDQYVRDLGSATARIYAGGFVFDIEVEGDNARAVVAWKRVSGIATPADIAPAIRRALGEDNAPV